MLKRLLASFASLLVSLTPLFVFAPTAHAATITWSGADCPAINCSFSHDGNWVGGIAPVDGDSIVFDITGLTTSRTLDNDIVGLSLDNITFTGSASFSYNIDGEALTITGDLTNNTIRIADIANDVTFANNSVISGSGLFNFFGLVALGSNTLTINSTSGYFSGGLTGDASSAIVFANSGSLYGDGSGFLGDVTINDGRLVADATALGTTAGTTTVNDGATLNLYIEKNTTFSEPIILTGDPYDDGAGFGPEAKFGLYHTYDMGNTPASATYNGNLTINNDITLGGPSKDKTVTISGVITGNHSITRLSGEMGNIILNASPNGSKTPNGSLKSALKETTISANQAFGEFVYGNEKSTVNSGVTVTGNSAVFEDGVLIVNGIINGSVGVNENGVLKGTGTVGAVTLADNGKLAPGLSPGCLNTGDLTFVSGTTYEFEVGGTTACTDYDQTKVTGTVDLGNGTLSLVRFNDFKPVAGQAYTIIENDVADAVTGTFNGLAEGATFTVDGYVFKISYAGGTGNDVVVTVQSVPVTPNTGFELLAKNPIQTFAVTTILAAGIALVARQQRRALNR